MLKPIKTPEEAIAKIEEGIAMIESGASFIVNDSSEHRSDCGRYILSHLQNIEHNWRHLHKYIHGVMP